MAPDVTVVVPVRNGGAQLGRVIAALSRQTLDRSRFEVVIADDGSTDGAPQRLVAEPWLVVDRAPPENPFAARNRGVARARASFLAFTDADCLPAPDWLERGLERLATSDFVAGRVDPVTPPCPTVWSLLDAASWWDIEQRVLAGAGVTANLLVRRDIFERLGGFDETIPSGGDFDFAHRCRASGARGCFASDVLVRHPTIDSARVFLRRAWFRNRWAAFRQASTGPFPERLRPLYWIPGMSMRFRRRIGLPVRIAEGLTIAGGQLSPARLAARLAAAWVVRDLFLHYWISAAQLTGWVDGRGRRP